MYIYIFGKPTPSPASQRTCSRAQAGSGGGTRVGSARHVLDSTCNTYSVVRGIRHEPRAATHVAHAAETAEPASSRCICYMVRISS